MKCFTLEILLKGRSLPALPLTFPYSLGLGFMAGSDFLPLPLHILRPFSQGSVNPLPLPFSKFSPSRIKTLCFESGGCVSSSHPAQRVALPNDEEQ